MNAAAKKTTKSTRPPQEPVLLSPEEVMTCPADTAFLATVGPAEAQWLIEKGRNYRAVTANRINMYVTDMLGGKWNINEADNIVIWRKGDGEFEVKNGQHRAHAVAKSGTTQVFAIFVTDREPSDENYDQGKGRTHLEFFRYMVDCDDRRAPSIALELLKQQHVHRAGATKAMTLSSYEQYKDAIDFVLNAVPVQKSGLTIPILLAMVRGYYNTKDYARLAEFGEQLITGKHLGDEDDGARYLRSLIAFGRSSGRNLFYLRCERAVAYFLKKQKLGASSKMLHPVPYPGNLLPIPPYRGPGSAEAPETVPGTTASKRGIKQNSDSYKVIQLIRRFPRVTLNKKMILNEFKRTYGYDIKVDNLQNIITRITKDPAFNIQRVKNAKEVLLKYVPPVTP